jgi:hypothetical protein
MTPSALLLHLLALRELFPRPIIQEWSDEEYQRSARDLDRRLQVALDRWDGKVSWLGGRRRHSSLTRPRDLPIGTPVNNHPVTSPDTPKGFVVRGVDGPGLDHELTIGIGGNPEIAQSSPSFDDSLKLPFMSSVLIGNELQCLVVSEAWRLTHHAILRTKIYNWDEDIG